ncbi:MAG: O-antigen ligase family protein [bacterium]
MSKLLTYGLYLLALALPLQTRYIFSYGQLNNGPWSYGDISLYGLDILLLILIVIALVNKKETKINKINWPKYLAWLIVLIIASVLSIALAPDPLLASFGLVKILFGLGLFWLLLSQSYDRWKFWLFFLTGSCLQAIMAIWQFLMQGNPASKWLGLSAHSAKTLGASVIETLGPDGLGERWLRAYGTLDHPNILGGLLVISLLLTTILLIKIQRQNLKQKKLYIYLLLGYSVIMSTGLFFTFSRAAWLALIVGWIILIIQYHQHWRSWLWPLIIMVVVAGYLMWPYHYLALARLDGTQRLEVKSLDERANYRQQAQQMIDQSWLTGVGLGNYGLAARELDNQQISYWYQPVHNTYLLIFAETGILGLLAIVFLLAGLFVYSYQTKNAYWPILGSWLILMSLDHWWWSLHYGQLLWWLVLALLINSLHLNRK